MLDQVIISPSQAQDILAYIMSLREGLELEHDEIVSDDVFTLSEIAGMEEPTSFGKIYRKYHVSSAEQPYFGGFREKQLAADLTSGSVLKMAEAYKQWKSKQQ